MTTRRLRALLTTALLSTLVITGAPAASAAAPGGGTSASADELTCPEIEAPFNSRGRFGFGQGVPWRSELGPEVDAAASWVRAVQRKDTAVDPVVSRTYDLHEGLNDLLVNAGRSGLTEVQWNLAVPGLGLCVGSLTQGAVDVEKQNPFAVFSSPGNGAHFKQGEQATFTYTCSYEGSTPVVESDCQSDWGPPGSATGVVTRPLDTSRLGWQQVWEPLYMDRIPAGDGTQVGGGGFYYFVGPGDVDPPGDPDGEITTTLELAQQDVRTGEWETIEAGDEVVAGNQVRVATTVHNGTEQSHEVTITTRDVAEGDMLWLGGFHEFEMSPDSTWTRHSFWDTADLAWLDGGAPRTAPAKVAVTTVSDGEAVGTTYAAAKVVPRPLVLVHGWKSNAPSSWGKYQPILSAGHPWLKGYAVGDGQFPGRMNTNGGGDGCASCRTFTVPQNAEQEATYIQAVREATNAQHVDILAHSMGGLISRYYVQELMPESVDQHPVAMRLVQMGTPNMGSELADMMMAFGVGGSANIPYYPASLHLTTSWVQGYFNLAVSQLRHVRISNMVGTRIPLVGMPLLPHLAGDGIVPADSARWTLDDTQDSPFDFHTAMTESAEDFEKYVRPRLAADLAYSEHGQHRSAPTSARRSGRTAREPVSDTSAVSSVQHVSVPAHGSVDLPVRIEDGAFGALTVSDGVRLEVVDGGGEVVAASEPGLATEVRVQPGTVAPGAAVLRVTEVRGADVEVDLLTYVAGSGLDVAVEPTLRRDATGVRADVRATVSDGGAPVTGATVTVERPGGGTVVLVDDGAHGDGAAADGVYAGRVTALPDGDHVLVTRTTAGGRGRLTSSVLHVVAGDLELEGPEQPEQPEQPEEPATHAPVVTSFAASPGRVRTGRPVALRSVVADADAGDHHVATVQVDAGPSGPVTVTPRAGGGEVTAAFTFATPGRHVVHLTVTDAQGHVVDAEVTVVSVAQPGPGVLARFDRLVRSTAVAARTAAALRRQLAHAATASVASPAPAPDAAVRSAVAAFDRKVDMAARAGRLTRHQARAMHRLAAKAGRVLVAAP